jgi:minor histocompatibility antigen H13
MELPAPLAAFLGKLAYYIYFDFSEIAPLIPTYLVLILAAIYPIYTGAHASLTRPPSASKPKRRKKSKRNLTDDEDDDMFEKTQKIEGLTPMDAITFPMTAGAILTSLYFLIKWLKDPYMLNKILNWYLAILGVFFLAGFLADSFGIIRSFAFPTLFSKGSVITKVAPHSQQASIVNSKNPTESEDQTSLKDNPTPGPTALGATHPPVTAKFRRVRSLLYTKATVKFYIRPLLALKCHLDIISLITPFYAIAVLLYFNLVSKPWWITNLLGFSFSYSALQRMSPTTFWTGTLLLSSLFLYDIYFVFYTPLMVTVATKLDIPIKLLIPRPKHADEEDTGSVSLAMLGLGDIVIPGMMIALALRYDLYLFYLRKQIPTSKISEGASGTDVKESMTKATYTPASGGWGERFWTSFDTRNPPELLKGKLFPKPYFYASLTGYFLGMVVTEIVLHTANHAQPALLYLVPGVLGSLWGTAWWRRETKEMWEYSEMEEEEGDKHKEEKDSKEEEGERAEEKKDKGATSSWLSWFGFALKPDPKPSKIEEDSSKKSPATVTTTKDGQSELSSPPHQKAKLITSPTGPDPHAFSNKQNTITTKSKSKSKKEKSPLAKASKLLSTDLSNNLIYFSVTLPSSTPTTSTADSKAKKPSYNGPSPTTSSASTSNPTSPLSTSEKHQHDGAAETELSLEQQLREAAEGRIRDSDMSSSAFSSDDEEDEDEEVVQEVLESRDDITALSDSDADDDVGEEVNAQEDGDGEWQGQGAKGAKYVGISDGDRKGSLAERERKRARVG